MNREQRRRYNKEHKTNWTKQDFETYLALERLKSGNYDLSDLDLPQNFIHVDNIELAPDGTEVKLNFDSLESRCKMADETNEYFRNWVAKAKEEPDKVYHISREGTHSSLVCLEEDENYVTLDGRTVRAPQLFFDLYADLLIQYNGKWVPVGLIDDTTFRPYTELRVKQQDKK